MRYWELAFSSTAIVASGRASPAVLGPLHTLAKDAHFRIYGVSAVFTVDAVAGTRMLLVDGAYIQVQWYHDPLGAVSIYSNTVSAPSWGPSGTPVSFAQGISFGMRFDPPILVEQGQNVAGQMATSFQMGLFYDAHNTDAANPHTLTGLLTYDLEF